MKEEDIIPVSAIEHFVYCPRQCMLIHVEQVFDDNVFTLRGRMAHERADLPEAAAERGVVAERALPIWSDALAIAGRADVVEFPPAGPPVPVEYKSGRMRQREHDDLQLCAQAICLEEMLGVAVPRGAVYSIASRRRREVVFDEGMRERVAQVVEAIRDLRSRGDAPPPANDERCPDCSLRDACVPAVAERARASWHLGDLFRAPADEEGET